jgi:putative ABC transport system substrate-binding protein
MRRREVIALFGGAAAVGVAWPLAARAQQPKPSRRIGILFAGAPNAEYVSAIEAGLQDTGYSESRNLTVELRWAEGRYERLPEIVADLARSQVSVIVTTPTPAALAAKAVANAIPIVFLTGGDPVSLGLVTSLNRPDGNVTGVSNFSAVLNEKRVELLHQLVPANRLVGVLVNPDNPPVADATVRDVQSAARALGLQTETVRARTALDVNAVFAELATRGIGSLVVSADALFISQRKEIVALAARHAIPAAYEVREFATAGGLLSYGTRNRDMFRQVGVYAGRILNGAKTADLPVVLPTKFELTINLTAAKAIGLDVPATLLALADEVIE